MKRLFATFAGIALLTTGTGCCHHFARPCGPCASSGYGAAPGYSTAMAAPVSMASAAPISYAAAPAACDCNAPTVAPY